MHLEYVCVEKGAIQMIQYKKMNKIIIIFSLSI